MRVTPQARIALEVYLGMGPGRSLERLCTELGKTVRGYYSTVSRWSREHGWQEIAQRHDHDELIRAMAERAPARERVIQRLVDTGMEAAEVIISIGNGVIPPADVTPVLTRQGEIMEVTTAGPDGKPVKTAVTKPAVPPSVRLEAAKSRLALIGIVPPKRVELSGPDKSALKLSVNVVAKLPDEALAILSQMLDEDDDGSSG